MVVSLNSDGFGSYLTWLSIDRRVDGPLAMFSGAFLSGGELSLVSDLLRADDTFLSCLY